MNSKVGMYYNEQFESLLVTWSDSSLIKPIVVKKEDMIAIFDDNDLVSLNILKISKETGLNPGLVSHSPEAIKIVNKSLKELKINPITHSPQLTVAKIVKAEPIPETHLNLCRVYDGENELQIICGAKNVVVNSLVVLATIGTWMPNGQQIKPSKLKGFESFGMLCSANELKLKNHNFSDGIIILDKNWEKYIGQDFMKVREENFESK
ncbi:YtpR family tRNA-binding protein [Spiroplasma alleghenense]|uniref:tRNA-binding protein n=1 Tax=Spiroplasma alleghenense TaxID=216931 RepID=A0A345Z462_9MOLU|nr:hypothetical protein [Spiroplasma alleghenense]AXK51391.1 tRNA-binding protein [Spiroplasma alleghenense]